MPPTPPSPSDDPQKPLQVLIVDDYDDNRELLRLALQRQGVQVVEAKDGIEAIKLAYRTRPDLILMDISMPVMDGLEAVRQLKGVETTRNIPIIVVSAHCGDAHMTKKAFDAGCTHCLPKPFELNELVAIVRQFQVG